MAKEIERRFLVKGTLPPSLGEQRLIKQGYVFTDKEKQLRVRIIDHQAFVCLKFTKEVVRDEFEYEVPLVDGLQIFAKCKTKLEKIRNSMTAITANYHLDVDTYPNGLVIAEVEFQSQEDAEKFVPVEWFGEEVTGKFEYSNITMAKQKLQF